MLVCGRLWWPPLPCPRQWRSSRFRSPSCLKGWEHELDPVGWDGESSPVVSRSSGIWVPSIALVAGVLISTARRAPVGIRIVGFLSVLVLGFVFREQVLQGELSEVENVLFGRSRKAVDNEAVLFCLNKLEGVVLAMKAEDKYEDENLSELERGLDNLKALLLGRGHAHVKNVHASPAYDSERASEQMLEELQQNKASKTFNDMHEREEQQEQVEEKEAADEQSFTASNDEEVFNSILQEADELLQEGQRWLHEDGLSSADKTLDRAIQLLNQAVETKPTNLVAVGMLANALLSRGQVKLKAAQTLHTAEPTLSQHETHNLQLLGEGCEELLVQAGRTYRRALLINRKDFRALHNWGVALSSRAELLSMDEDALEGDQDHADKIYLAAIDKFEAVVGLDQDHAAPALVNWATAVRHRSRLKNRSTKERLSLLLQARQLLLDAAKLDPSQLQVNAHVTRCDCEDEIRELQRDRRWEA